MRAEEDLSKAWGMTWQKRGPPGPGAEECDEDNNRRWRHQRWRPRDGNQGGGRWGNPGGKHKWFFIEIHKTIAKKKVPYPVAYREIAGRYGDPRTKKNGPVLAD